MSGSASLDLGRQLLQHTLAIAPMPTLTHVYVALCQVSPPPTEGTPGIEALGGGYARVPATFATLSSPSNVASNATTVEFPAATASWGNLGYFEVWTAPTGGTRQYWGPLVDPIDTAAPKTISVLAGSVVRFPAGVLAIQVSDTPALAGGPWLPIAGGEMLGPLDYAATDSTVVRSAQDRAADVVNVVDKGADPTGVSDSTAAFNAAAAAGRRMYIPRGRYKVTDASMVTGGQIIYGDGPRSTLIDVNSATFNMGARGVFDLAPGTREQDVEIRDLWIRFAQPNFAGMTRADIIHYPPAINSSAGNRAKFVNLQITNAWVGIEYDGGGAGFLDRVEISAYSAGLSFAATAPVLDGTHVSNYHWWNFDMTLDQAAVMWDGISIAADIGRIDGLVASDWIVFKGDINIRPTAGVPGFYYMTNIVMDSTSSTLTVSNAFVCEIVNFHSTKGAQESPAILVTGGRVSFTNLAIQSAMVTTAAIQITGGGVQFNGGTPWWKEGAGAEFVSITGGNCTINNITFATHVAAHTAPFVHQSGTGFLVMNNCQFPPSGVTGVAVQMDTVVAGNWIGPSNTYGGLGVTGAGFVQPVIGRFNATSLGAQLVGSTMTGALGQEGKLRLLGSFPTGADTVPHLAASLRAGFSSFSWAGSYLDVWLNSATNVSNDDANTTQVASFALNSFSLGNAAAPNQSLVINGAAGSGKTIVTQTAGLNRWAIQHDTVAEGGSNAGANLSIIRFSDAGGSLGTVLQASRANGTVGFNNTAPPAAKPTVTGAKGSNAALASLLTALAAYGLITDSSTA